MINLQSIHINPISINHTTISYMFLTIFASSMFDFVVDENRFNPDVKQIELLVFTTKVSLSLFESMSAKQQSNESLIELKEIMIHKETTNQLAPPKLQFQQNFKSNEEEITALLNQKIKEEDLEEEQDSSDDEAERLRELNIKQDLLKENLKQNANKKMVVGTGFSMDVTEFFQFEKKKQLSSAGGRSLFEEISGSRWAWLILLYSLTTGAIMPGWIMNIKANKILRISWRFFMQMIMVIPFVLYEYRTCDENNRKKYSFQYIFNPNNMIKPLISSLSTSLWFTTILFGFEWTSVSHSIVMGSLSNFFLSIGRSMRKSSHDLESGGQMFVVLGIMLVLTDTLKFTTDYLSPEDYTVNNTFYYNRKWWERITFDLTSFTMSFFMSQFSKYTSDLRNYYPPFLSMLVVNTLTCILMAFSSFFLHGCSFQFDSFWGIWSLFSNLHFSGFMFMAIILSLGQMISMFMITRMFPDPIIPALAMTLEPFIASLILDFTDIQRIPGKWTFVGYLLMVPGLALILVGQCLYQRISNRQQEQEKKSVALMRELKQIQQKLQERQRRKKRRSQHHKSMIRVRSESVKDKVEGSPK